MQRRGHQLRCLDFECQHLFSKISFYSCSWGGGGAVQHKLTNMAKALGLVVAVVVLESFILFGAVVPGELKQTLAVACLLVGRQTLVGRVGEEVQVETRGGSLVLADQRHTKNLLVELERLFSILDAEHGVVLCGRSKTG